MRAIHNECLFFLRILDVQGLVAQGSSENETCWSIREHIILALLLHSVFYLKNFLISLQLLVLSGLYITHRQRLARAKKTTYSVLAHLSGYIQKAYSELVPELIYLIFTIQFVSTKHHYHEPPRLIHLAEIHHTMTPRTSTQ
jgi:hypothetical protein